MRVRSKREERADYDRCDAQTGGAKGRLRTLIVSAGASLWRACQTRLIGGEQERRLFGETTGVGGGCGGGRTEAPGDGGAGAGMYSEVASLASAFSFSFSFSSRDCSRRRCDRAAKNCSASASARQRRGASRGLGETTPCDRQRRPRGQLRRRRRKNTSRRRRQLVRRRRH
jgi:hypothetical protein